MIFSFCEVENAFNRVESQKIFNLISSDVIAIRFSVRYSSSGYLKICFLFTSVKGKARCVWRKKNNSAAIRVREPPIYQTISIQQIFFLARINSKNSSNALNFSNKSILCLKFCVSCKKLIYKISITSISFNKITISYSDIYYF